MSGIFSSTSGTLPLLVSVPHDGREIPAAIAARMTPAGRDIPDTDWHVARLYGFVRDMGASTVIARYSRYVVDLNRPESDERMYERQLATGLCPTRTFAGADIYRNAGGVSAQDRRERIERYWRPYHDFIAGRLHELREAFGYALLWDAHSIASRVPRLFDGELPVLNIGTFDGRSCAAAIAAAVAGAVACTRCSSRSRSARTWTRRAANTTQRPPRASKPRCGRCWARSWMPPPAMPERAFSPDSGRYRLS